MRNVNEEERFVIKDNNGMYSAGLIYFDEETNKYTYSYSERLVNNYVKIDIYPSEEMAKIVLDKCKNLEKISKFNKEFYIEKINLREIIIEESKLEEDKIPIRYEYKEKELAIA